VALSLALLATGFGIVAWFQKRSAERAACAEREAQRFAVLILDRTSKAYALPTEHFSTLEGKRLLPNPVSGKVILRFGQLTPFGTRSRGVIFVPEKDKLIVTSPVNGLVLYAGEFKTYGYLLIIEPEVGFHLLLVGLSEIDAKEGDVVTIGEQVGMAGSAVTMEVRKARLPFDPAPWFSAIPNGDPIEEPYDLVCPE
jgi:septal ring factor EnvC (AmiA/AmiB activator)